MDATLEELLNCIWIQLHDTFQKDSHLNNRISWCMNLTQFRNFEYTKYTLFLEQYKHSWTIRIKSYNWFLVEKGNCAKSRKDKQLKIVLKGEDCQGVLVATVGNTVRITFFGFHTYTVFKASLGVITFLSRLYVWKQLLHMNLIIWKYENL